MITTSTTDTSVPETTYDFSRFTKEDEEMYKDILLSLPYNPDLAQFFYDQKKLQNHELNHKHKWEADVDIDSFADLLITTETPEKIFLQKEASSRFRKNLKHLSEVELRRLLLHDIGHMTYDKIAEEENVKYRTVRNCVQIARWRIVNSM